MFRAKRRNWHVSGYRESMKVETKEQKGIRSSIEPQHTVAVAVFKSHHDAEAAVKAFQEAGYDMKKLSVVGQDYYTEQHVVGYYTTGARMRAWGMLGAFWGGIWGLLFGWALFIVPGVGPVLIAGPFVTSVVAALETAALVGGLSALGAALYSIDIPKKSVLRYETQIKAGKYLLLMTGSIEEIEHAEKEILAYNTPEEFALHHPDSATEAEEHVRPAQKEAVPAAWDPL